MKLTYTQRVLARSKAALESENTDAVVDQAVIDAQPTDEPVEETTVVAEEPAEDLPVDAGADETVVTDVVETTDAPVDGIEPIEPPQVVPTTDSGEATVDQVEAIAEGNPEEAAVAVADVDNAEGADTTPEEVIEEAEIVAEETPAEDSADDATPEASDELENTDEAPVESNDITPEGDVPSEDGNTTDAELEVAEDVAENEEGSAGESETATEDCACEDAGTNPPANVIGGNGEEELPPEVKPVDDAKGDETLPAQEKEVDSAAGEETKPCQEKVTAEGKGEETLPPSATAVADEKGDNVPSLESDGAEDVVVDAPAVDTPDAAVAVVEGEPAEAPAEGVVEVVTDEPVVENQNADDAVVADDAQMEIVDYVPEGEEEAAILNEALDTYPQVIGVLQDSLDNGGVSVEAMKILNIFTARDGNALNSDVSLESYNFTARTQTRLAIESLGSDIKEWVTKLIELIKRGMAHAKEFMRKRFDELGILERRAEALSSFDKGKTTNGQVNPRGIARVSVEGKVPSNFSAAYNQFAHDAVTLNGITDKVVQGAREVTGFARHEIVDTLVNGRGENAELPFDAVLAKSKEVLIKAVTDNDVFSGSGETYQSKVFMGDWMIKFSVSGNKYPEVSFVFEDTAESKNIESATALSANDISTVASTSITILKKLADKKAFSDYETLEKETIADLERLRKLTGTPAGDAAGDGVSVLRTTYYSLTNLVTRALTGMNSNLVKVVDSALDYAEASAKTAQ